MRLVILLLLLVSCAPAAVIQEDGTLVENLDTPWAIDFLSDGSMIFTERGGAVSMLRSGELSSIAEIDVSEESESGLHGIAVHPDFTQNRYLYLYYTHATANRVSRFRLDGTLQDEEIILDGIPSARNHDGGRIAFGPDGKLYIATGDALDPSMAQDTDSLAGKILRINDDGSIPDDNPFGNSVWSYGHRNPQGIAWGPDGTMYAAEHGPSAHDEINIIERGMNYGWPGTCGQNPEAQDPLRCYREFTLAPSGIAWHDGALYVTGLRGMQVRKLTIEAGEVMEERVVIDDIGRIREIVSHDGKIYFATSNRDGRGVPRPGDDRIARLESREQ